MSQVTDMVIRSNQSKLQMGSIKRAIAAKPQERDKDDNLVQVEIKAQPAVQKMFLLTTTDEIMGEVIARMAEREFSIAGAMAPVKNVYGLKVEYIIDPDQQPAFRAAFKATKTIDNKPGLDRLAKENEAKKVASKAEQAEAKAKARDERKAKKDAEKEETKAAGKESRAKLATAKKEREEESSIASKKFRAKLALKKKTSITMKQDETFDED